MKTIIVTGASRGIGFETALKLSGKGHHVIAISRSKDKLEALSSKSKGGKISPLPADLTSNKDLDKVATFLESMNALDGIINNAGAFAKETLLESDINTWKKLMDVNVYGIVRLVQACHSKLKSGAHIVNISSMSGYQGSQKFPGLSAYGASKAAVIGLTEVLSTELADQNISVNCLCLGAVQTEMLKEAFPGFEAPVSAKEMGTYLADFVLNAHKVYNGKVLPVALNNPE